MKFSSQLEYVLENIVGYRDIADSFHGGCGMYFTIIAIEIKKLLILSWYLGSANLMLSYTK